MKRAHIRTRHGAETARLLATALDPDNTPEMRTRVDGDVLVTTVDRETTGGLGSTVDDYLRNLQVAAQLTEETTLDT